MLTCEYIDHLETFPFLGLRQVFSTVEVEHIKSVAEAQFCQGYLAMAVEEH